MKAEASSQIRKIIQNTARGNGGKIVDIRPNRLRERGQFRQFAIRDSKES